MITNTHNGMTTLAAAGPLDEGALVDATLRTCDRGHIAIAWKDWDTHACPICGRFGELSGVLVEACERAAEEIQETADEQVADAEADAERLRAAMNAARATLDGCLPDDLENIPSSLQRDVESAYHSLNAALTR